MFKITVNLDYKSPLNLGFQGKLGNFLLISGSESGPKEDVKKEETTVGEASGEFAEFSAFDLILTNQFADFNIDYLSPTPTQMIVPSKKFEITVIFKNKTTVIFTLLYANFIDFSVAIRKMDAVAPPLSIYSWDLESNIWTKLLDTAGSCHSTVVIHPEKVCYVIF